MLSTSLRSKSGDKSYSLLMDTWETFSKYTQTLLITTVKYFLTPERSPMSIVSRYADIQSSSETLVFLSIELPFLYPLHEWVPTVWSLLFLSFSMFLRFKNVAYLTSLIFTVKCYIIKWILIVSCVIYSPVCEQFNYSHIPTI